MKISLKIQPENAWESPKNPQTAILDMTQVIRKWLCV